MNIPELWNRDRIGIASARTCTFMSCERFLSLLCCSGFDDEVHGSTESKLINQ